jgi:hydroxypyruvate reductase
VTDPETFLRALFARAVAVADPMQSLAGHLPPRPEGRVWGLVRARQARAWPRRWRPNGGLVRGW